MATKIKLTSSKRVNFWQKIVDDYESSGLPIGQYCRLNHITHSSFYSWRTRLKGEQKKSQEPPAIMPEPPTSFIALDINHEDCRPRPIPTHLELHFPSGIKLIIPDGSDFEFLGQLLKAVG
jgi:hypothetical protein